MDYSEVAGQVEQRGLPPLPEPLPVPTTDAHTHLDVTVDYCAADVDLLMAAAQVVNVTRLVQIGCDVTSSAWAVDYARQHPQVVAAVAMHPNDAARAGHELDTMIAEIDRLAGDGDHVRAVGETGLDYYRTREPEGHELQRRSFAAHIDIAKRHDLALAIHDRDAHDDILTVLDAEGAPDRVIFHCYSGDADFARRCLDRDCYLSFSGTVTFKANQHLRDALLLAPIDRILVETDAPFLTPVPLRGRPNGSYLIPHTVRYLAELRGDDVAELCDALRENAFRAYGGPWGDADA